MAKRSGIGMKLYVGGYDISGDVGALGTINTPVAMFDVTAIDKLGHERIEGQRDAALVFSVFFNDATGQAHPVVKALPSTDVYAMLLFSTTAGDEVFAITAKWVDYALTRGADGSLGGTVTLTGTAPGTGPCAEWADLLLAKTTHASASDAVGIDGAAQSTKGAVGFLQHFSAASGTVEYDIEDSSDSTTGSDGVWANLLAFADVPTPYTPAGQRVEVAGTVERWTRASTNGTFTTAVFAMALRRKTAYDVDAAA